MRFFRSTGFSVAIALLMAAVIVAAFVYAPSAKGFIANTDKIVYFHVPCAWTATLAFVFCAVWSVLHLKNGNPESDRRAAISARLGLLFTILATVTGSIWARVMWNSWWNWDPRQTSIVTLMLVYGAYLALRGAIEDPARRGRLAAGYALLAVVTVPFLMFILPRIVESLHPQPVINAAGKREMSSKMFQVLSVSGFAFLGLFLVMLGIEDRIAEAEEAAGEAA